MKPMLRTMEQRGKCPLGELLGRPLHWDILPSERLIDSATIEACLRQVCEGGVQAKRCDNVLVRTCILGSEMLGD